MVNPAPRDLRRALVRANIAVRENRPPYPEYVNVFVRTYQVSVGRPRTESQMYQFWFRTRGCTYDRAGQCSMCNYGIGPEIRPEVVARAVERKLATVPQGSSLYLSPSGSLLDEKEVPPDMRDRLLRKVAERRPTSFAFETRPEVCTREKLERVRELLPSGTRLVCQIGVESWDPEIRNMCHLKPTRQEAYLETAGMLRSLGFDPIANITLGGLGLSPREAYQDTLAGVRGARAAGFGTQMVFPLSAKAGTLIGWAHDRGLWEPPTLWMLVRLLAECADDSLDTHGHGDLDISWFNPQVDDVVQSRPDGCERCRPTLIAALSAFRLRPRRDSLDAVGSWDGCDCASRTDELLHAAEERGYYDRLVVIADRWASDAAEAGARTTLPVL
ncbi:radical SAM enzyme, TIGR01210 family [Sinosporangium album]|uniref:Radical SAM enzyme, TIGR01210 family n=1 Tax=Sinosporangium album TaxID=504805 RepID=A0A1G8A8G6_9ACTN|nr:radical SAM protein [Sinosporangium album]SDH17151.1 radical SAM enzyme, TIGR01210 family [Sinosporangium album]